MKCPPCGPHVHLCSWLDNFVNAGNLMGAEYLTLLKTWKGNMGCSPVQMGKYLPHTPPQIVGLGIDYLIYSCM